MNVRIVSRQWPQRTLLWSADYVYVDTQLGIVQITRNGQSPTTWRSEDVAEIHLDDRTFFPL